MRSHIIVKVMLCAICWGVIPYSNAAIVDLSRLDLDSVTFGFTSPISFSNTTNYSPPYVWNFGAYQGVVASASGSLSYTLESTGAYNAPPSSGTVDTSLGTIDLSFPDLHLTLSGSVTGDFDVWHPNSTIDANSYDPNTGAFSYGWSDSVTLSNTVYDYSVIMNGTASPVPIPSSVLLFGSGLVGMVGLSRQKRVS